MTDTTITPVENVGWKGLAKTLWQRVVVSYETTLIGIAIVAGTTIADNMLASPNKVISIIGMVLGAAFALYKKSHPAA